MFLLRAARPISHRVGPSVTLCVRPSHFAFFAFLGILRVGKFVFEHAPAQIITAPTQLITAPVQPPATGVPGLLRIHSGLKRRKYDIYPKHHVTCVNMTGF